MEFPPIGSTWGTSSEGLGGGDTVRVTVLAWSPADDDDPMDSVAVRLETGNMVGIVIHVEPHELYPLPDTPYTKFDDLPDDTPF